MKELYRRCFGFIIQTSGYFNSLLFSNTIERMNTLERNVNRLKMIKQLMYEQTNFDILCTEVFLRT